MTGLDIDFRKKPVAKTAVKAKAPAKKEGTYTPKAPVKKTEVKKTEVKKPSAPKKGKKTLYQYLTPGGKTPQQEREERKAKREKKREAAFARRRNR